MKNRIMMIIFFWALSFSFVFAHNILVWDNDNNSTIADQLIGQLVGCEYSLVSTLAMLDQNFTVVSDLPEDLSEYDLIIVTLGKYCLG